LILLSINLVKFKKIGLGSNEESAYFLTEGLHAQKNEPNNVAVHKNSFDYNVTKITTYIYLYM